MSLFALLVALHVGSTAGLLLLLAVVIVLQRGRASLAARLPARGPGRVSGQQVVWELDPRTGDRRIARAPEAAGATRRSS